MKFGMRVGSPQIIQCRTAGNRRDAAAAKFAKSLGRVGAKFEARPPFAHLGAPMSMTRTRMPFARASRIVVSRSAGRGDRRSTRLNSGHRSIWYAVFSFKKKRKKDEAAVS